MTGKERLGVEAVDTPLTRRPAAALSRPSLQGQSEWLELNLRTQLTRHQQSKLPAKHVARRLSRRTTSRHDPL